MQRKEKELNTLRENLFKELNEQKSALKNSYAVAINEAKTAAKAGDTQAIHRAMNKANNKLPRDKKQDIKREIEFKVGDNVQYHTQKGTIKALKSNKEAIIEINGMTVRVKTTHLKPTKIVTPKPQTNVSINIKKKAGLKCDLHGMRADEATEVLDKFLSDALINGWDEVIIYHGIGTGKLSYAVKNFLKSHPRVKSFDDAPQHLGGFGAKIVYL